MPGGGKKRVRRAVLPLANDPSGRPVKGVVGFAAKGGDDEGAEQRIALVVAVYDGERSSFLYLRRDSEGGCS